MLPTRHAFRRIIVQRRFVIILTAALFVLCLRTELANSQVRKLPKASKFQTPAQKEALRKFDQKRREFERKWAEKKPEPPQKKSEALEKSLPLFVKYRLSPGRQFAYQFSIEWQSQGKAYRVLGRPFYHVRYQNEFNFPTMVIGHLRQFVKTQDEEDFRALSHDYWMPSVQVLRENEIGGIGRPSKGHLNLPYLMTKFVGISTSIVPKLTTEGKEEDAVLLMGQDGPSLWEGFTSGSSDSITGRVSRWTETKVLNVTQAQVDIKEGFIADKTGLSAMYVSRGTFDLDEGLLQQSQGIYELKDRGQTTRVSVTVRRLSGAEFDLAKKEALEKLSHLPQEVIPIELAR